MRSAPFHMPVRQQRLPVVRDSRRRAAQVCFFKPGILGFGQSRHRALNELPAAFQGPVLCLFRSGQRRPLGVGQVARRAHAGGDADVSGALRVLGGAAAGSGAALPPAAGREHPAHRRVGLGGNVMDEVHHGDGSLHQSSPLYSRS